MDDERDEPTTDQPLHGEKRPRIKPVLLTIALFAALALLFWFGFEVLISAE